MELVGKLRNAMSGAIPGNPVTREFDVSKQVGSAGPGLLWKIFPAVKKSTKQEASVWLLEKKSLDRYSKSDREFIIESLKKGVASMTRLRHPKILAILHPLEESRESLGFATEPLIGSLANLLGQRDNLTPEASTCVENYKLYDVEIKYGALMITEGLAFLHNDCKQLHGNVCPESIAVTKSGAWKLAGFDFTITASSSASGGDMPNFSVSEWSASVPHVSQPKLNFCAPEIALRGGCSTAADMFSLGMLLYAVYNNGKLLFDSKSELSLYRRNVEELRQLKLSLLNGLPENLREWVKLMLNFEATVRPDAFQFSKVTYFQDPGSAALQFLDNLFQLDNLAKSQFYKGLPQITSKLPHRVNLHRVFPQLSEEFANPNMVPFVLPSVLQIAEASNKEEFVQYMLPKLIPVFQIAEPIQITLVCLQNLSILLNKCPKYDIKNHILPMMFRAVESDNAGVQELCLDILPTVAHLMDYSCLKNSIVPRLKKLILGTGILGIRVNGLVCLGKLLEHMDKWFVLDEVLPILGEITSREPAVLMSVVGIYRVAFTHSKLGITKDQLANRVLPHLLPLAIDSNLNLTQFNVYIKLIREMVDKVEQEQTSKLEQLHSLQQEQKTLQFTADSSSTSNGVSKSGANDNSMMSQLMSGFGVSQPAPAASPKKPPTAPLSADAMLDAPNEEGSVAPTKKTPLSLEEKQKLAAQQEQASRMKSQGTLQPKVSAPKQKHKPKDLTASLMDQQLSSMSMVRPPAPAGGPMSQFGQPMLGWHAAAPSPAPAPVSNYGGWSPMQSPMQSSMQPSMQSSMQPPMMQQQRPNMTALDNLFGAQPARPTLSQMQTQPRPPQMQHQPRPPQMSMNMQFGAPLMPQKPPSSHLSANDINDLLG